MRLSRNLFFSLIVLVAIVVLTSCRATTSMPTSPAHASISDDSGYWTLVKEARAAYSAADFERALTLARQAAAINPDENTAWELYQQASVARAGDEYLTNLPGRRYCLPVDVFVRDQVNHSKEWLLIDVRKPEEFAAGHIKGAVNIPLRELLQHLDELPNSKTAPILLYCHSQKRATHALVILHELGYIKAYNLEGGYAAYEDWLKHNPTPTPGSTPTPAPEEPDFGC